MTKQEIKQELKGVKDFLNRPINNTCKDCEQIAEQIYYELNKLI